MCSPPHLAHNPCLHTILLSNFWFSMMKGVASIAY